MYQKDGFYELAFACQIIFFKRICKSSLLISQGCGRNATKQNNPKSQRNSGILSIHHQSTTQVTLAICFTAKGQRAHQPEGEPFLFLAPTPTLSWVRTWADGPVAVPAELCHHSHSIGSRLPHLGAAVTHRLQHGPQEVLGILEGGRAAVLHHVVKNAQPPLPVCPRPMWTLRHKHPTAQTLSNCCTAKIISTTSTGTEV